MSELSGKQVKSMKEAYASIYSNINEEVSEEEIFENFYSEIEEDLQLFVEELKEIDLHEGPRTDLLKKVAMTLFKQTTGFLTQPKTKTGRVVRAVQQLTTPAVATNQGGSRDYVVGAAKGAVQGAVQGVDKTTKEREKKEKKNDKPFGELKKDGTGITLY